MCKKEYDSHGVNVYPIITPEKLKSQFPLTYIEKKIINNFRTVISNIIHKRDPRLLIICGPCSIHDIDTTLEYASKLRALSITLQDQLYIVMRVYLEKPRTSVGWKGMINDPYINGSCDIELGLSISRSLLKKLIAMNLPLATEVLNPYIPRYIGEFFSWSAIGARTTESQIHREVASGLCSPIGFKNNTNGSVSSAINAISAAMVSHRYISIGESGQACVLHTSGNLNGHIILRGGDQPNYYPKDIIYCEDKIRHARLPLSIMIDCSHGNSNKDYRRQIDVVQSISDQIKNGNSSIIGLMLESYIHSGNQNIKNFPCSAVKYGVSITDACIDWKTTKYLLCTLHEELKPFLSSRLLGSKQYDRGS